ncbi:MAG: DUF554 family protein [Pseudorhodobacter sp.]|nr:DUF554 family protein [Frankiaceae bacterium]
MLRGAGTALNVATVLLGSGLGVALGGRLPERTRSTVTDALGLVTLVIGGLNIASGLGDPAYIRAVSGGGTLLVVLGALLVGGITGSLLRVEDRLDSVGAALQRRLAGGAKTDAPLAGGARTDALLADGARMDAPAGPDRARFVQGFVTASLVFCVGPLAVLGPLSDGLGNGIDQLALKSTLDGFAALAFAASLGWGVAASALSVLVVQGSLTILGAVLGSFLPLALVAALTATGGVLLLGVGLRLLAVKAVPVGDLLPALVAAPLLAAIVDALR